MFESELFANVLGATAEISLWGFFSCVLTALVLGATLTNVVMLQSNCTKSFAVTIALFPLAVCTIVMLVSDNFGAGLAIAGAFSLIRFKSASGAGKEITALFISVAIGIACGTGYIGIAVFFTLIVLLLFFVYSKAAIWENHKDDNVYSLRLAYTLGKNGENVGPMAEEIVRTHVTELEKKKVSVSQKKSGNKTVVEYSLTLASTQEELVHALSSSGMRMEFSLEKDKKPRATRL